MLFFVMEKMMRKLFIGMLLLMVTEMGLADSVNNNHAMLFVTLGMPKLVLRQYLVQSKVYGIPVVIRGLLDNSYPQTTQRIYDILHPNNKQPIKAGVEIDPTWFKQFDIKAVPALVIHDGGQFCSVYGNAKISNLLGIIQARCNTPAIKKLASLYLEKSDV